MTPNNLSQYSLRRIKWLAFGATGLAVAALEAYYYLVRGVPLRDNIIDWLLGMGIAYVIFNLTFRVLEHAQQQLQQTIAEHRHVEETLQHRLKMERLIANLSTHFINLPSEKVDEGIQQALQQIGEFTDVDRSYVFLISNDLKTLSNTHEWCAPGIEPQIANLQNLPAETFSWWMEKLHRLETIHIPRVADLPPEAAAEKEILQAQDIQSLIVLPLIFMERPIGFIGFDSVRVEKTWSDDTVILLQVTADAIASVLERKRVEMVLRRSRHEYEELVNSVEGIVWEVELTPFRFTFVSRYAERLLGYPRHRWYSEPDFWENHIHPDDRKQALDFCRRATEKGVDHQFEYRMLAADGRVVWIRDIVSVIIKEGRPVKLRGIMLDITDRKEAEQAEREQRLLAETLRDVTLTLAARIETETVLDEILQQARRLVDYSTANIMLLDENTLRVARHWGYDAFGVAKMVDNLTLSLSDIPLFAESARLRRPVLVQNTAEEPRWIRMRGTEWIQTNLTLPLVYSDRVLGFLNFDADTPAAFTPADAERLQPLAAVAAIALHNARLYEQARHDAEAKAILLKEVNHRVKNNLTAIIGILYTERHRADVQNHPMCRSIIETLVNRVQGLATVHNLLSASEWQPVRVDELATRLIRIALHTVPLNKRAKAEVSPSTLRIPASQANNLAMVLNELAMNSIKHALSAKNEIHLTVDITLAEDGQSAQLVFRDDGPGYPESVLHSKTENVGLYLVKTLVHDGLGGEVFFHNDGGAATVIRFPLERSLATCASVPSSERP